MCCSSIALPCLGPEWSLHLAAPRRRHPVRPRRSCRRGFRSLHSWPRWSSSGAGSLWPCTRYWGCRHYLNRLWKNMSGAHGDMSSDPGWGNSKSIFMYVHVDSRPLKRQCAGFRHIHRFIVIALVWRLPEVYSYQYSDQRNITKVLQHDFNQHQKQTWVEKNLEDEKKCKWQMWSWGNSSEYLASYPDSEYWKLANVNSACQKFLPLLV